MLKSFLYTALGSFMGGGFRFLLSFFISSKITKTSFPFSIILINIFGSFLMGFLFYSFEKRPNEELKTLVLTGVLGGFTTFSSFSMETIQLFQSNEPTKAIIYVVCSLIFGILFCFMGYKISTLF